MNTDISGLFLDQKLMLLNWVYAGERVREKISFALSLEGQIGVKQAKAER